MVRVPTRLAPTGGPFDGSHVTAPSSATTAAGQCPAEQYVMVRATASNTKYPIVAMKCSSYSSESRSSALMTSAGVDPVGHGPHRGAQLAHAGGGRGSLAEDVADDERGRGGGEGDDVVPVAADGEPDRRGPVTRRDLRGDELGDRGKQRLLERRTISCSSIVARDRSSASATNSRTSRARTAGVGERLAPVIGQRQRTELPTAVEQRQVRAGDDVVALVDVDALGYCAASSCSSRMKTGGR